MLLPKPTNTIIKCWRLVQKPFAHARDLPAGTLWRSALIVAVLLIAGVVLVFKVGSSISSEQTTPTTHGNARTNPAPAPAPSPGVSGNPPAPSPAPATGQRLPSQVLNLTNWKLTVPTDSNHDNIADEINQPELATYTSSPYFVANSAGDGVVFRAYANGATTSNSNYPRSELREMTNNGADEAKWSSTSGTHTMTIREAITHLPSVKPGVVAGQIHNASDDVIMIELNNKTLYVENNGKNIGTLDANYALGTAFTVTIVASDGHLRVSYNGAQKVDFSKSGSGYYFKAGCYTQSNLSKGDSASAYAEVIIYGLSVSHT